MLLQTASNLTIIIMIYIYSPSISFILDVVNQRFFATVILISVATPNVTSEYTYWDSLINWLLDDVSSSKDASPSEDSFLSRLLVTGATESSFTTSMTPGYLAEDKSKEAEKIKSILHDIAALFDSQSFMVDKLHSSALSSHKDSELN